jgi:SAM-dependent methyltransferase
LVPGTYTDLADILACPACHGALHFDPPARAFACTYHGLFPLSGEFPSFVSGHDRAFEEHWENNRSGHIAVHKLRAARAFLAPLLARAQRSTPMRILDAGCGEGAHVSVLAEACAGRGDRLVAIDIAISALHDAARHGANDVRCVHADMSSLPFQSASFDAAFSFGVLHLTPQPRRSFEELCRVLRPGGMLGLWVFRGGPVTRGGLRLARLLARILGSGFTRVMADMMVPFYGAVPTRSGLALGNSSWRQTREVLLSNLTPPHMHFLTPDQLARWCEDATMTMIESAGEPITIWAVKR